MPMSPRPEVVVLPMKAWSEANPLEATPKEPKINGDKL